VASSVNNAVARVAGCSDPVAYVTMDTRRHERQSAARARFTERRVVP